MNTKCEILKKSVSLIIFCFIGLSIYAQSRFVVDPVQLNLPSVSGSTELSMEMVGGDSRWTLSDDADWLIMEPTQGEGAAIIHINYDINEGYRRFAEITFSSDDPEVENLVIEVRQFMGIPMNTIDFKFSALIQEFMDPLKVPFMGIAHFNHTPTENHLFLNLIGKKSSGEKIWLIKNAFLPSQNWNPDNQGYELFFSLNDMGFVAGENVSDIDFSYCLSYVPDSVIPYIPGSKWLNENLREVLADPYDLLGQFLDEDDILNDTTNQLWYKTHLPASITDLKYAGCRIPNEDLDFNTDTLDKNGCGPAAAANSLKWLEQEEAEIDGLPDWRSLYEQLHEKMKVSSDSGVSTENFIRGKLDIIEAYGLPIKVKYQSAVLNKEVKSSSGNSSAHNMRDDERFPEKDFIVKEIMDDEDVEIFTSPSITASGNKKGIGHIVVATGTVKINDEIFIWYKHDRFPGIKDTSLLVHSYTPLEERDGALFVPGLNGYVTGVVSESYDPDYQPEPDSEFFNGYCNSFKRTLPPGGSLVLSFPENSDRCFNVSVRAFETKYSKYKTLKNIWNFNSGKSRKYHNESDHPVTIEIHNDDNYKGQDPKMKSYSGWEIGVTKILNDPDGQSDPSNLNEYGGISIGTNDDSHEEFGSISTTEVVWNDTIGAWYKNFPSRMKQGETEKLKVLRKINVWNRYWSNMECIIGVDSLVKAGWVYIESEATGVRDSIVIINEGDYQVDLGGIFEAGIFDVSIQIDENADFYIDNIGIPSNLLATPFLKVSVEEFVLNPDVVTDTTFIISNMGTPAMNWQIEYESDWFTISPKSGQDEAIISLYALQNREEFRFERIKISSPDVVNSPQYIMISQDDRSSVNQKILDDHLSVFPNPAKNYVNIQLHQLQPGLLEMSLYGPDGKVIWNQKERVFNAEYSKRIDTKAQKGIYFLKIRNENRETVRKIMISE